jgi:type IV secretion system protein VirD4
LKNFFYHTHILHSRLSHFFSSEKPGLSHERFALPHELIRLSHTKPDDFGLILGNDEYGRILQITTKTRKQLGNVLKVAPSQGGKSTDFKHQLIHWKGSAIVNDIKGELSRDTAQERAKFSAIHSIDLTGNGASFNPLQGKTEEHELYAMAKLLLHESREDGSGIAFTEQAIEMLMLLFQVANRAGFPPFFFVSQIVRLGLNRAARQIHEIAPDIATQLLDGEYIPDKNYTDNKYLANSWELLKSRMYPLLTEAVVKTLTGSSFKIADLLTGKRPVTIYLQWSEQYLDSLKPLMKLMWGTFIDELKTAYKDLTRYAVPDGLHKILFLIDEGGVTPIPELYNHVSTVNGYGMSFVIGIQSLSQLDMYGKSNAETILNNCSIVIFKQKSFNTAKIVSEWLGGKSGFASSHTSHGQQTSEGKQEREVPLLSAQEIRGMSKETLLIFTEESRFPIVARRMPEFKRSVKIPPPPDARGLRRFMGKSTHNGVAKTSEAILFQLER